MICIKCEEEFEVEVWENGKCPKCELEYNWEEYWTEDGSDCWAHIEWQL